jgi:hypothetical protein
MFPTSINKAVKKEMSIEKNSYNFEMTEKGEKEYEIDENENENEDFYKYVNGENDIYENYIERMNEDEKYVSYKAIDYLEKNEPNVNENTNVYICAYSLNKNGKFPFLGFVMKKYPSYIFEDMLTFPCFTYMGKKSILDECNSKMNEMVGLYDEKKKYSYTGYFFEEESLYMFFDVSDYEIHLQELYRHDPTWLVIVDEILNHKHVCNFPLHNQVTDFFSRHVEFCMLYDKDENLVEIPIVCYNGVHESKLKLTGIFGTSKEESDGLVGPYYYFTSYNKSFERGGWSKNKLVEFRNEKKITENEIGKYDKGGIVRFAVFAGNTKVALNYPNDNIDESEYKKQILQENNNQTERQTMRITDYDGKWADSYDSIYIGNLELDDGKVVKDAPYWVVKDYNQQVPISYHYIDKRTLGNAWDENEKYYIR